MPRFSVVIPCFNSAETIDATLASLASQTLTDWEAICVDDGSSDGTLACLEQHARADRRIRVLRQQNAGPSRARNAGVATATGRYVAFLDADDLWLPGKLASVAAVFGARPEALGVFGRISFFRSGAPTDATTSTVRTGPTQLISVIGENPVCTLSNLTVERRRFQDAGGFDEEMRFSEDLEWLIRVVAAGEIIVGTNELHVRYRTSEGGLSADLIAMHSGWRRALNAAGDALSSGEKQKAEAVHLRYLARRALRTGASARVALSLLARGLRLSPQAFLGERHRGPMTLIGCLLSPFCPLFMRRRLFA